MTNPDLTLLGVLADKSGSMNRCRDDSEGGLNNLVQEQAALPGDLDLAVADFDTRYRTVRELGRLTTEFRYTLNPGGGTALLDAMGSFITEIGRQLAKRPENERPSKVIILIVTDGQENSSKEWTYSAVKELVERQKNDYQWEFIFLGANIDAIAEGQNIGVGAASSINYDVANAMDSYAVASANISNYRLTGETVNFSDADRQKTMTGNNTMAGNLLVEPDFGITLTQDDKQSKSKKK